MNKKLLIILIFLLNITNSIYAGIFRNHWYDSDNTYHSNTNYSFNEMVDIVNDSSVLNINSNYNIIRNESWEFIVQNYDKSIEIDYRADFNTLDVYKIHIYSNIEMMIIIGIIFMIFIILAFLMCSNC